MFAKHYEGDNLVIEILPGLLEARTNQGFGGQPCLIGKRTFSSNLPFAKSIYENPEEYPELHEVQRVALYAFALGREWERRGLQERMKEAFDVARKKRLEAFMETTRVRERIAAKGLSFDTVEEVGRSHLSRLPNQRSICPCTLVEPCKATCTCANTDMSGGCNRCATYGSEQQRLAQARRLARLFDVKETGTLPSEEHGERLRAKEREEMIEVIINLVSPSRRLLHRIRIINQGTGDEEKGNYTILMDNPSEELIRPTTVRGIADFDRGRGALSLAYEALSRLLQADAPGVIIHEEGSDLNGLDDSPPTVVA